MKKPILLLIAFITVFSAFAQNPDPLRTEEIATVGNDNGIALSVLCVPSDNGYEYFLNVGQLAVGNKFIQIVADHVSMLFIPLGKTIDEALHTLERIYSMYGQPNNSSISMDGCLAPLFPNNTRESIKITNKKLLLTRQLEFSIEQNELIKSTSVMKSDMSSLIFTMKGELKRRTRSRR